MIAMCLALEKSLRNSDMSRKKNGNKTYNQVIMPFFCVCLEPLYNLFISITYLEMQVSSGFQHLVLATIKDFH